MCLYTSFFKKEKIVFLGGKSKYKYNNLSHEVDEKLVSVTIFCLRDEFLYMRTLSKTNESLLKGSFFSHTNVYESCARHGLSYEGKVLNM